jgi:hypothetical protein
MGEGAHDSGNHFSRNADTAKARTTDVRLAGFAVTDTIVAAVSDFHRGRLPLFFMIAPWLSLFSSEASMSVDTGGFGRASSHEK